MNHKKSYVLGGLAWTFGERITAQVVSLVVSVILALLLDPDHYAPVAVVTIFITIANAFVTGGFGNSLVQKKDADELDFSTTLIFSFLLSVVFYWILFFCAPLVSLYYEDPQLTPVLRVMSIRICIASINSIQHAYVSKKKAFRMFFFSTLGGTIISAVVGILMAYKGFGVWALVAQYLTNTTIDTIVLNITCKWRPSFRFSFQRMKGLFSYGWKLLVTEVLTKIYQEARGLILSAGFEPVELSYFNQATKYPGLFINNVEASMHKVLFQKLSDEQDDLNTIKNLTRKTIELTTFVLCPVFLGLAACGNAVIEILLTKKWLPCVAYMQIICFTDLIHPIFSAHTRAMKALGNSKAIMYLTILRYTLGIGMLLLTLWVFKEPHIVTIASLVALLITTFCCGAVSRKSFHYTFSEQLLDVIRTLGCGVAMLICVLLLGRLPFSPWFVLIVQVLVGAGIYIGLSYALNRKAFMTVWKLIRSLLKKLKGRK